MPFADLTPRDVLFQALGVDAEIRTDHDAVEAELRERERHGLRTDHTIREQLVAKHTSGAALPMLDFTREVYDAGTGEWHTATDHNQVAAFTSRLKVAAAIRDQGPGSGVATFQGGQWVGDPDVIARIHAGEAERAAAQAAAQARQDAAAGRFTGPYNVLNSVR